MFNCDFIISAVFDYKRMIGIIAGIFVLASFIPKKEYMIRLINIFGCLLFVIYGGLIQIWEILAINLALLIMQIIYLILFLVGKKKSNPETLTKILSSLKTPINEKELLSVTNQIEDIIIIKDKKISALENEIKALKNATNRT